MTTADSQQTTMVQRWRMVGRELEYVGLVRVPGHDAIEAGMELDDDSEATAMSLSDDERAVWDGRP